MHQHAPIDIIMRALATAVKTVVLTTIDALGATSGVHHWGPVVDILRSIYVARILDIREIHML